jgi:hypothetical protein
VWREVQDAVTDELREGGCGKGSEEINWYLQHKQSENPCAAPRVNMSSLLPDKEAAWLQQIR